MKKKIYQIEVNDPQEGWTIPEGLFSWQVFSSYEKAEEWALKHIDKNVEFKINSYKPEDIEDFTFVE